MSFYILLQGRWTQNSKHFSKYIQSGYMDRRMRTHGNDFRRTHYQTSHNISIGGLTDPIRKMWFFKGVTFHTDLAPEFDIKTE